MHACAAVLSVGADLNMKAWPIGSPGPAGKAAEQTYIRCPRKRLRRGHQGIAQAIGRPYTEMRSGG